MGWSGVHDGCPRHGHATDTEAGDRIGCICARLLALDIVGLTTLSIERDGEFVPIATTTEPLKFHEEP